ncbi:hypothetical protein [Nostoc sp.]|uniref:hypothetical protein n=1 Tax=Nostoc sp. TaxID=1180 RepID=UPI002FF90D0C
MVAKKYQIYLKLVKYADESFPYPEIQFMEILDSSLYYQFHDQRLYASKKSNAASNCREFSRSRG